MENRDIRKNGGPRGGYLRVGFAWLPKAEAEGKNQNLRRARTED